MGHPWYRLVLLMVSMIFQISYCCRIGRGRLFSALRVVLSTLVGAMLFLGSAQASSKKPLRIFLLVGQSNMQGHAKVETLEHIGMDAETAPWLVEIQNPDGSSKVCKDVWISYLSTKGIKQGALTTGFGADAHKIGPELTFGISLQKHLGEPVLIIKAAWGGKSLHTDFRPPSAGIYSFEPTHVALLKKLGKDPVKIQAEQRKASGHYYRLTVDHVKSVLADIQQVYPDYEPEQGYQLSGLVWFQGWNDMVASDIYPNRDQAGGYADYTKLLRHFIRDMRNDLSVAKLPVVIGVMGVGGPTAHYGQGQQRYKKVHQNFRDAMAATAEFPEFKGNVSVVLTENYWDVELAALVDRDVKLRQQIKQKKLQGEDAQVMLQELRQKEFSVRELTILKTGVSNYPFHYLGSAKIIAGIGRGFADAMSKFESNRVE